MQPKLLAVVVFAFLVSLRSVCGGDVTVACPLPADVPTLDWLAGDWKNREDLEQFPSIHNFNGQMLVNKDMASISWLASAPFSQGFHSGALKLDGKVPVAEKFRWYPYQTVRAGSAEGLRIETTNRMVFDARGVLWRIGLTNTSSTPITANISVDLIGAISKLTAPNAWDWGYAQPGRGGPKWRHFETEADRAAVDHTPSAHPGNAEDYRATVAEDRQSLAIGDTKTAAKTVFAFASKPDALESDGHQGVATWRLHLAAGETKSIEYAMAFGEDAIPRGRVSPKLAPPVSERPDHVTGSVAADAARWASQFDAVFDNAKRSWEGRYAQAFTPGNGYFGGNLPTLQTNDLALRRNYYMGAVTILLMLRDQLPHGHRVFVAGGPRYGASVQFIWDTGLMDTLFALLEPQAMREYVAKTLQVGPRPLSGVRLLR